MRPRGPPRASLEVRERKTAKASRTPLNGAARQALADYLAPRPGAGTGEPLFLSGCGGRLYVLVVHRNFSRASRAAGLERSGSPSLRKTFGLMASWTGKELAMVQRLLNHAPPGVTLRYRRA
ncbi:MAG: tyrosine-type recombinase/integrase [Deltaproteobacteria bacterium]|nr:tyrosine-type recombinase/integrase [Deltaproteobacteria bacterium]